MKKAYSGSPQLLVFNTKTGATILNTNLPGLAKELGASQNLFDIWDIQFF